MNIRAEKIKIEAERIRKKLQPPNTISLIYGEIIDMNNPDEVLVAAVAQAQTEMMSQHVNNLDMLLGIKKDK